MSRKDYDETMDDYDARIADELAQLQACPTYQQMTPQEAMAILEDDGSVTFGRQPATPFERTASTPFFNPSSGRGTMTDHNCVRNPDTGSCYVCKAPMLGWTLDAIVNATEQPETAAERPAFDYCKCGAVITGNSVLRESLCTDCWIAEQTKQPAPQPKPVKQTNPVRTVTLDSILSAMAEDNPNKWN